MININRIHFEPLLDYANNRIYFVYFVSYRTVTESRQPMRVIFRFKPINHVERSQQPKSKCYLLKNAKYSRFVINFIICINITVEFMRIRVVPSFI